MTQVFNPSSHAISNKILASVLLLLVITSGSTVVLGTQTGELDKKIISPLKNNARYLFEALSTSGQAPVTNTVEIDTNSSSSTDVNTNNQGDYTPQQQQPNINFPIYNTPTPNPTAVEWERQFEQKQAEMQREFEESKQKVCASVPDAPGCH